MRHLTKFGLPVALALVPLAVQAQDASAWSGFYAGVQAGAGQGDMEYEPGNIYDLDGHAAGVFVGYMVANGAFAYGGELAYSPTTFHQVNQTSGVEYPDQTLDNMLDIKGRVGYAAGNALIYGVLGLEFAEHQEGVPNWVERAHGPIFGLGVDLKLSERLFFGLEVLRRNADNSTIDNSGPIDGFTTDMTTVSLRVGMTF